MPKSRREEWMVRGQKVEILAIGMLLGLMIGMLGIKFGVAGVAVTLGAAAALGVYIIGYILGLDKALPWKISVPISFWSLGLGAGCALAAFHLS